MIGIPKIHNSKSMSDISRHNVGYFLGILASRFSHSEQNFLSLVADKYFTTVKYIYC